MITLHHLGIASEMPSSLVKVLEILGLRVENIEEVQSQGVRTHFIPLRTHGGLLEPQIEILEPIDPEGTVAKFLKGRGPGIHHVSFLVEQGTLETKCQALRDQGMRLIYDTPKPGAHAMRVNFIHPSSAGGILIELMERQT
jgi:methylmalonyl-CoA epimerase